MGRTIGELCPSCKTGRLRPVFELPPPLPDSRHGSNRPRRDQHDLRIERLACPKCQISYETDARGLTLAGWYELMSYTFVSPDPMPDACPHGHGALTLGGFIPEEIRDALGLPNVANIGANPVYMRTYGFCPICSVLVWVRREQKTGRT